MSQSGPLIYGITQIQIGTVWLLMHNYVTGVFCLQGLWMNSSTFHGNWDWVGFEIIPPGSKKAQPCHR